MVSCHAPTLRVGGSGGPSKPQQNAKTLIPWAAANDAVLRLPRLPGLARKKIAAVQSATDRRLRMASRALKRIERAPPALGMTLAPALPARAAAARGFGMATQNTCKRLAALAASTASMTMASAPRAQAVLIWKPAPRARSITWAMSGAKSEIKIRLPPIMIFFFISHFLSEVYSDISGLN